MDEKENEQQVIDEVYHSRLEDLENKVSNQRDEITCLRSTLADVLRRLSCLEESRNLPAKNGIYRPMHQLMSQRCPQIEREPVRRVVSHTSALPQRKSLRYQSTGSLHSDSQSSSSMSPVRMSPTPQSPSSRQLPMSIYQQQQTKTRSPKAAMGNLQTSKRWSSTGDFKKAGFSPNVTPTACNYNVNNRLSTKSLLNLHSRSPSSVMNNNLKRNLMKEVKYTVGEEGLVHMNLRGRRIHFPVPSALSETYDTEKVAVAPQSKLKLEWVYGYRGKDCRSNLYLLPTGEIVYFVAAVVVLYNSDEQNQRHYLGHTDDVKCMAIHPNKLLVGTGQVAGRDEREGKPHIRIWNSVSLATISIIGLDEFERSISCLSFSKADGGGMLCAIDEANDHCISLWDWQRSDRGYKITETKCSNDTVIACEFHPLDRSSVVTCGKNHVYFWTLDAGGMLFKKQGLFEGTRERPKFITCLAFTQEGDVLTGDSNGNVIIWARGKNTMMRMVKNVHEGAIFSICVLKDGSIISGGGKDGRIIQFNSDFERTGYMAQIAEHLGGIRTLSEGKGSQLLVGSTRNCILVGSLSLGFSPIVLGHTDELWALAAHPELSQFITAGYDKIIQLWDAMAHTVVWSKDIEEPAQSACFTPDGSIIIVGGISGKWIVMDVERREIYAVHEDGNEPIQVLKFSPNGEFLAIGSRDNFIYIYQVGNHYKKYNRVGKCSGHSSFITHMDWSSDSHNLRSNSGDYEILYWNAMTCSQITQITEQMRETTSWATNSCTLSFDTIGIWPEGADGTDVNACSVSHDWKLLASGDDFGKVKLFTFPSRQPRSLHHTYGGHSSHVTNVEFLRDDSRLISVGGKDTSVFQWEILK